MLKTPHSFHLHNPLQLILPLAVSLKFPSPTQHQRYSVSVYARPIAAHLLPVSRREEGPVSPLFLLNLFRLCGRPSTRSSRAWLPFSTIKASLPPPTLQALVHWSPPSTYHHLISRSPYCNLLPLSLGFPTSPNLTPTPAPPKAATAPSSPSQLTKVGDPPHDFCSAETSHPSFSSSLKLHPNQVRFSSADPAFNFFLNFSPTSSLLITSADHPLYSFR